MNLEDIETRYVAALEAKPSKGPWTSQGVSALCDSVADVQTLLNALGKIEEIVETPSTEAITQIRRIINDERKRP